MDPIVSTSAEEMINPTKQLYSFFLSIVESWKKVTFGINWEFNFFIIFESVVFVTSSRQRLNENMSSTIIKKRQLIKASFELAIIATTPRPKSSLYLGIFWVLYPYVFPFN